ncbi:MAG: serine/threonine-protein kinase [Verrucomicrobia bacterium]|nr:serine/threonine-protein kinase [Verrucomicrobiota bacterium]
MDPSPPEHTFVPPTPAELGPLFPSYDIIGFIAAGGMGAVYQAQQRSLDRPVAIKILPREFGDDAQFRAAFEAEAKAMARLNHPNLIGVYDFGNIDGMLYIVMELVSGKSLHYSAHGTAIEQKEAARIVTGICRGLAHAHQAGILHRDIKPANILLTQDAQPKIGDFGLARPVGHEHGAHEVIFGTPGYSASEVLNHPEAVDERTDLYAVGIILYELLTGKLPATTWQPPSTLATINPAFDNIVRRATHPSRELRYADANELADELEQLAKQLEGGVLRKTFAAPAAARGTAPIARPIGTAGRHSLPIKKSSSGPVLAVVVILLLGLAVLGLIIINGGDPPPLATSPKPSPIPPPIPVPSPEPQVVSIPKERDPRPDRPNKDRPDRFDKPNRDNPRDRPEPQSEPVAKIHPPMPADPDPTPEPEPVVPSYPPFDTVEFIDSGRLKLQQMAVSRFNEHEENLTKNIDRLERAAERVARRVDNRFRDPAEAFVEGYISPMRETNRIGAAPPEEGPDALKHSRKDLMEAYQKALARQNEIEEEFLASLDPIRDSYINGLQRMAGELRNLGNTPAEKILSTEADKTRESLPRFIAILKGDDPETAVAEAETDED